MTAPRPIPTQDGDDLSQQYTADALHALDADLATAEGSMLGHLGDPGAHPQIDGRSAPAGHLTDYSAHASGTFLRAHVDNAQRHVPAGSIAVPAPPATGSFQLKSVDGVPTWVPFP